MTSAIFEAKEKLDKLNQNLFSYNDYSYFEVKNINA